MAVKHVKEHYDRLAADYHEMTQCLEDMQAEGVPKENVEAIKQTIEAMKTNFETWNYMIYLLNKPNKKSKQKRYNKPSFEKELQSEFDNNAKTINDLKDNKGQ